MTPEFMNRIIRLATKATIEPTERSRSPGRDHEGRADRDDGDEGAARRDIGEVGDADEIRIDHRADDQQQDQRRKGRDGPQIDIPPGSARISQCLASSLTLIAKPTSRPMPSGHRRYLSR